MEKDQKIGSLPMRNILQEPLMKNLGSSINDTEDDEGFFEKERVQKS